MSTGTGSLRIGEFARRVGVNETLLRAWERRYGLLSPVRSPGGFRLYSEEDVERVARMRRALDDGLSAAQAAHVALEPGRRPPDTLDGPARTGVLGEYAARLLAAIDRYDEPSAHAVLDEILTAYGLEAVLRDVILPTLTRVGRIWEQDPALGISQEHFATNLIRGRLLSLARLWSHGRGPLAVLACAPGEAHDITLLAFGLLLCSRGWRILFLGADTPVLTLTRTAEETQPALVALVSFKPEPLEAEAAALRGLARTAPLVVAGPGASDALCVALGARRLGGDLIDAATVIARGNPD
ncbi:MAG: MerR family transcriptional regulator [Solirubrobacteraceae bacterium]